MMTVPIAGTPPLPALSPGQSASQTPQSSPDFRAKYQPQQPRQQPDLLDTDNLKKAQQVGPVRILTQPPYILQVSPAQQLCCWV